MKNILLCLLLLPLGLLAQAVRIDSLPPQGFLLDKGWRWHAGDNPDFAKPDFDDSKWEHIDPTKDIFDLPQLDKQNGQISWFRLHLSINPTVNQQLMFRLFQSGASEIFVNGNRFWRFGELSTQPNQIRAYDPRIEQLLLPKDSQMVVAVRYVLQPRLRYTELVGGKNPALNLSIGSVISTLKYYDTISLSHIKHSEIFRIGAFFILFILFLSFYLFYPSQKTYLYFCLYALWQVIGSLLQIYNVWYASIQSRFYLQNVMSAGQLISFILLLTALHLLLNQRKTIYYWFLLGLVFVGILTGIFFYKWSQMVCIAVIPNVIIFEIIRISLKAIYFNKRGAWTISIGGICLAIFWILFIVMIVTGWINIPLFGSIYILGDLVYNLYLLSIPVAVSIYIGLDVAFTNRSLQQKIIEVETLSAEKHQILAAQNETLERQVEQRTAQLKASQTQLIQKEKLASLGELTAGIAHEIQNPLNFVNNFSELSVDLAQELNAELDKEPIDKEFVKELMGDLIQNQEKINHHGKRASSIVKGMLEHSRMSTGERQLTDLNALCDEYLRLSYHGMRAKNNQFNADYELITDPNLPNVNVVPQDIGRVLLNLINNAFYAAYESKKPQPKVIVSSDSIAQSDGITVIIRVKDNGNGIPADILPKIFQPFFTTKPTGEGTGLGLSLSYDIITKGHGGTLEVESVEGEGATFIVTLPL